MKNIELLKKLSLEENLFHKLGDAVDDTTGNSSFLKGLALGGLGLAAFSDPETAGHVKEAISGIGDNLHNFWNNLTGNNTEIHQHTAEVAKEAIKQSMESEKKLNDIINQNQDLKNWFMNHLSKGWEQTKEGATQLGSGLGNIGMAVGAAGAGLGVTGLAGYGLYKILNNKPIPSSSGLSSAIKKTKKI